MAKDFKYTCLTYAQRCDDDTAPEFCLFHAPVGEILQWADIERLENHPRGAQRSLNPPKVRSVSRYLEDTANTIPTAVVIALDVPLDAVSNGRGKKAATLSINVGKSKTLPGVVIDGQHRLLGMNAADPTMHVNVVALLTDDENETAFQFLVINNKAARVATDHIKAILAEREDERLKERLRKARLSISSRYGFVSIADADEESPFHSQIDWVINRNGEKIIKPAAIETSVKDIQDRNVPELEEQDNLVEFYFTLWRVIKEEWPELWSEDSKLLSKVGIVCMTQYLTDSIISSYDLGELDVTDTDAVGSRVRHLIGMQRHEFWQGDWTSAGYDTQAGRRIIVESLVQIARNVRQKLGWKTDVKAISSE
ncbi:MAG: DGQHR domain-containing protein [Planctomycetota bacterium]|nr:DGQHR domain-containing protein [Planctomycetota bacterium]